VHRGSPPRRSTCAGLAPTQPDCAPFRALQKVTRQRLFQADAASALAALRRSHCQVSQHPDVDPLVQASRALSNLDRVTTLSEALPYLQKFSGKTIVVKYGGAAMKDPTLKVNRLHAVHLACFDSHVCPPVQAGVISDLVLLSCVGIRPILVHGGGPEINSWLEKLGIKPEFKNGLRVTDGEYY
jgi:hypothetical protein